MANEANATEKPSKIAHGKKTPVSPEPRVITESTPSTAHLAGIAIETI